MINRQLQKYLNFWLNSLHNGKIIALKGIGGYHIACDAENDSTIKFLRERKNRPAKPFAVMMKDIKEVERHAYIADAEKKDYRKRTDQ